MCTKFQHSSSSGSRDIKLRKASRRVGPGRAGPCHIKNGFYIKKENFWYQSDLSTTIFKDFMSCLFFPYTCRISSLTLAITVASVQCFQQEILNFYRSYFIASVRELILHVYGKNKQDISSLKIVVERSDWYQNFSFFM